MPTWEELFHHQEHRWETPHEMAIQLVDRLADKPGALILDLGCGAGRHVAYLREQGFRVEGMDISRTGLSYAHQRFDPAKSVPNLVQADMTALPYASGAFDALITIYVIFHNSLAGLRQSISEIDRVLKPGGLAALTFQSRRSCRYGSGQEIEPHTFLPDSGVDAGISHHFSDLEELSRELNGWIVRSVELHEDVVENKVRSSHWWVWVEKPEENA